MSLFLSPVAGLPPATGAGYYEVRYNMERQMRILKQKNCTIVSISSEPNWTPKQWSEWRKIHGETRPLRNGWSKRFYKQQLRIAELEAENESLKERLNRHLEGDGK